MLEQRGFTEQKDVGIDANVRPNALNVRGQQPNLYPFDAFRFDDPNRTDSPKLGMAPGWNFDVGTIFLESLDSTLQDAIEQASISAEENRLSIKNTDGQVLITGETVDIIARELNLEAETISLTADKVVFTGGSGESLDGVLVDDGTEVVINGRLIVTKDTNVGTINVSDRFEVYGDGRIILSDNLSNVKFSVRSDTGNVLSQGRITTSAELRVENVAAYNEIAIPTNVSGKLILGTVYQGGKYYYIRSKSVPTTLGGVADLELYYYA